MLGQYETGLLTSAVLSCSAVDGLRASTADGHPARLAILDGQGNVIEVGEAVEKEATNLAMQALENLWRGQGRLIVFSRPPAEEIRQTA